MIDKLNALLQALRRWARKTATQISNDLTWGYGFCATEGDAALREYQEAVKRLRDQSISGGICICDEELDAIIWGASKHLGPECNADAPLDYSKTESPSAALWRLQHPGCVAYDTWAEQLAALCALLNVDIKATAIQCEKLDLDLRVAEKIVCSRVELLLQIEELSCDLELDFSVAEIKACAVQVETEVMPYVCDIDFKTAVKALVCGVGVSTLLSTFGCDISLNPIVTAPDCDTPDPTPCVVTLGCSETAPYDCQTFLEIAECPAGGALEFLNQLQFPTIEVTSCNGCSFIIPRTAWGGPTIDGVYPMEYATWSVNLSNLAGDPEAWPFLLVMDCLAGVEIKNAQCYNACAGDPGCEADCDTAYLAQQEACGLVQNPYPYPSAECLLADYTVTITLENYYNYVGGGNEAVEQYCFGNTSYTYTDRNAVVTDSYGNTFNCVIRFYDLLC